MSAMEAKLYELKLSVHVGAIAELCCLTVDRLMPNTVFVEFFHLLQKTGWEYVETTDTKLYLIMRVS